MNKGARWEMPRLECPICARVVEVANLIDAPHRPFCSLRCKRIDLGRWLDGTYAVSEPMSPADEAQLGEAHELDDRSEG